MEVQVGLMVTRELQMVDLEALVQPVLTLAVAAVATQAVAVAVCKRVVVVTYRLEAAVGLTRL
jgi:hypothetical protein